MSAPSSAQPRASVTSRVLAKVLDLLVVFALAAILPYPVGPMAGFVYSLVADGLRLGRVPGQSLGKKALKLKVVVLERRTVADPGMGGFADAGQVVVERRPATLKASCLRNAPVGVATFFAIIPLWGWFILGIIGLPLMVVEVYLMLTVPTGHRLGDVMGDTEVVSAAG